MTAYEIAFGVVLLQEGRQANLGAISGAADSFMEKGKARTLDAKLAKVTKICGAVFFVATLLVGVLSARL